jgi:hypothetical protein
MGNGFANAAFGIGIGLLVVGIFFVGLSPILGLVVGLIPVILGILGLNKLKKDPTSGGKVKAIIGIVVGALMVSYTIFMLIMSST